MKKTFALIFMLLSTLLYAQDPQYSQYYAAPLYLNPAMTGLNQQGRAGVNYRSQWPSIAANFETTAFSIDHNIEDYNSSVGFQIINDSEGLAGLRRISAGLFYAYQLELTDDWVFRPAVEVSYFFQDLNFDRLVFGDQFDAEGNIVNPVTSEPNTGYKVNYPDLSFGGLFFSNKIWIGGSIHHILEPNQSFVGENSPLYKRISFHGGYKIPFGSLQNRPGPTNIIKQRSIAPTFNFRRQGDFDQLDAGLYADLDPIITGIWYRGIPIKQFDNFPNTESIITMIGIKAQKLTIGYSFDFPLSQLGLSTGGAHELSLTYVFSLADPRKPPKHIRELKCPVPYVF